MVLLVVVFVALSEVKKTGRCPSPLCDRNCVHYGNASMCEYLSLNVQWDPHSHFTFADRVCVHKDDVMGIMATKFVVTLSNALFFVSIASAIFFGSVLVIAAIPVAPLVAMLLWKRKESLRTLIVVLGWLFLVVLLVFFGVDLCEAILGYFEADLRDMRDFFVFLGI